MNRQITKVVCLLLAGAASTFATSVNLTLDPNFPTDYPYYTYTTTDGGTNSTYTGPYQANVSGDNYDPSQIYYVFCLDFNVDTFIGTTYTGSITIPVTETDIEVAYLEDQVFLHGGYSGPLATIAPYAMAIWQLMNPSSFNPTPFAEDVAAQALVSEAIDVYSRGSWTAADAQKYSIWIPDSLGSSQRFGIITVVPEPGTAALVGAGILAVFAKRRHSKANASA